MILQELIDKGIIPYVTKIDGRDYLDFLTRKYGIVFDKGFDTVLSESDIIKLRYNSELNDIFVKQSVLDSHEILNNKYNELIDRYTKLYKEMKNNNVVNDEECKKVEDILKGLNSDFKKHKETFSELENVYINKKAMFDLNNFDNLSLLANDNQIKQLDEKISVKFEQLNKLDKISYSRKFKQATIKYKMSRIQSKIKRLQNKKGKLQTKQKKIINRGNKKYVATKNIELYNKLSEYQRNETQLKYMTTKNQVINAYSNDLRENQDRINELNNSDKLFSKLEKKLLEMENKGLQSKLDRLQKSNISFPDKNINAFLQNQYCKYIEKSIAK